MIGMEDVITASHIAQYPDIFNITKTFSKAV